MIGIIGRLEKIVTANRYEVQIVTAQNRVRDSRQRGRKGEGDMRRKGKEDGKKQIKIQYRYSPIVCVGYSVLNHCDMDTAAVRLALWDHPLVLYCQRWLLGNIEPGPVDEHTVSFDLLHWMCDTESNRVISPGVFMAALLVLGYNYFPTMGGFRVGCARQSARDIARRQTNGG